MARRHDPAFDSGDFNVTINDDGTWPAAHIQIAILADIRRELRKLNGLLHCPNFQAIPRKLDAIRLNTRKPKRRKVK